MLSKPSQEKQPIKMIESADSTSKDMSKATTTTGNEEPTLTSSPEFSSATAINSKAKLATDLNTHSQN